MGLEQKFWDKVSVRGEDKCWEWQGAVHNKGYGQFSTNGVTEVAHRVAWVLEHGEVSKGSYVTHKCNNKTCVNPKHLELKTRKGQENPFSKLSESQVKSIKAELSGGTSCSKIAAEYSVGRTTVIGIRDGKTWAHVIGDNQ